MTIEGDAYKLNESPDEINKMLAGDEPVTYEQLKEAATSLHMATPFNLVSFIIGYQGHLTGEDYEKILKLMDEGVFG